MEKLVYQFKNTTNIMGEYIYDRIRDLTFEFIATKYFRIYVKIYYQNIHGSSFVVMWAFGPLLSGHIN